MNKTIRYATPEDAREFNNKLLKVFKERVYLGAVGYEEAGDFKNDAYHVCIVAEVDKELAGYVSITGADSSSFHYIGGLYVTPKFRGNGIGTELLKIGEEYCLANWYGIGIDILTNDNDPMESIIKKAGYKLSGYYRQKGFRNGKFYGQSRWVKLIK